MLEPARTTRERTGLTRVVPKGHWQVMAERRTRSPLFVELVS